MNDLGTFIFIGRSGCGKGTQAALLSDYLEKNNPADGVFIIETGEELRDFAEKGGYLPDLVKKVMDGGELLPAFVSVFAWAGQILHNLKENQHIIMDGAPRRPEEASIIDSAFKFLGRRNVQVIFLNVSEEWSVARLKERGRGDDLERSDIKNRMKWLESHVMPTIKKFKETEGYIVHDIQGEQTIEEVHKEIISKIPESMYLSIIDTAF